MMAPRNRKAATPRRQTGKQQPARGLRIQLKGLRTTRELRAMLHEAIDRLEAQGITVVRGSNLYVTPADTKGNPLTRLSGGAPLEDIEIAGPYRSAAEEHGL
jgi:hypothetical protein